MKNIRKNKKHWYIYIIIVAILVLSMASWAIFAQGYGNILMTRYNAQQSLLPPSAYDTSEGNKLCNMVDKTIDEVDSSWVIYKQSLLSHEDSVVTYYETGEISSTQVIEGANSWLFYGATTDGDSIADYEGTNKYTKKEMNEIYKSAQSVQTKMEEKGIKFTLFVSPNKENIYSEYMPDSYVHSETSRTDLLIDYLSDKGVNIVSPKKDLLKYHNDYQLYYSYDTHWNQLGAYIGVKDTLKAWGINLPKLEKCSISSTELKDHYHYGGDDDLAQMIGMRDVFSDEIEYSIDGTLTMDWDTYETEQKNGEISHFHNDKASTKAKLLIVGDSFRSSMLPSLREQFSDVYVVYRPYFESSMVDEVNPDYVIAEYVERYSDEIKDIDQLFE